MHDPLIEAKSLVLQADTERDLRASVDNLIMAITLLIGLVEGHRHDVMTVPLSGPMQAMEGRQ